MSGRDFATAEKRIRAAARPAVRALFNQVALAVAGQPVVAATADDTAPDPAQQQPQVNEFWRDTAIAAIVTAALISFQASFLRTGAPKGAPRPGVPGLSAAQEAFRAQLAATLANTPDQVFRRLATVEQNARLHGLPAADVRTEMTALLTNAYADQLAEVIARTTAVAAVNAGERAGQISAAEAAQPGSSGRMTKTWHAEHDERTRHTHAAADGQTVALNDWFDIGGFPGLYPGDPELPASEVVNCRCHLEYAVGPIIASTVDPMTSPETALPDGWRGPICALDVPTSDGRMAATPPGGVRTRAYPLTLTRNHVGDPTGYPTVGSVDHVWVNPADNMLWGEGRFDLGGADGQEAARQLAGGFLNRVSIDPVEVEAEMRAFDPNGNPIATPLDGWDSDSVAALPEGSRMVTTFADWTLAGLATVPIPAYTQAAIQPVWNYQPTPSTMTDAIVAAAQPDFSDHSMVALRPLRPGTFASPHGAPKSDLHVTLAYLGEGPLPEHVRAAGHSAARAAAMALHGDATATVAGYGHIGDPSNPATVLYLNGPAITAAHKAATGAMAALPDVPEQHSPFLAHMTLGYGVPLSHARTFMGRKFSFRGASMDHGAETTHYPKPGATGIVAGAGGHAFRRDFFQDPNFEGPTALTVTEDGHVFGHVRVFGTCYQYGGGANKGGACVQPPPSACGYSKFMVHGARMDDGSIMPVGALTFGDGHESRGGLYATREHYNNVATVAAKVVAGEDEFGVWISGEVLPEFMDRAYDLLLAPLSGHWEPDPDNRGHLEMIAAHLVVTPGYSVRRIVASFDEDEQPTSLILTTPGRDSGRELDVTTSEDGQMTERSTRGAVVAALADLDRARVLAARLGKADHFAQSSVVGSTSLPIADPSTPWSGSKAGGRVLDAATGPNGAIDQQKADKGFLWRDGDGSNRGDYKFPIADVIGGTLKIVPRAVAAAAGRLDSAKGIDTAKVGDRICTFYGAIRAKYSDWPVCPIGQKD